MAQATASVQLNALAAPDGTGGAYQYAMAFGPSQVARIPKTSADTSTEMVTRLMRAPIRYPHRTVNRLEDAPRGSAASDLEARFDATVRDELARPGTRSPPFSLRLPPSLRETMRACGPPEHVAAYYCERMPRMLVEQMLRGDDRARSLLWRPLELSRLPRLSAALHGLFDVLGAAGFARLTGAASVAELLRQRPTAAALAAPTLLGSGLPLVGAWPAERELINSDPLDDDAAFDLRLSGGLMHELCHGLSRPLDHAPPPWMVLEAAALLLGSLAFPRHVFPGTPGEAVPGVSLFVLVGQCLARLFEENKKNFFFLLTDAAPLAEVVGPVAAQALEAAAADEWRARPDVPFARDALAAAAWVKVADAARAGRVVRLHEAPEFAELPWWSEEPAPADFELARAAVRAVRQVNLLAPTYQTHPCEARVLTLDTRTCIVERPPHPRGVFGEPAFWIVPPPICRKLREHGKEKLQFEHAEELWTSSA